MQALWDRIAQDPDRVPVPKHHHVGEFMRVEGLVVENWLEKFSERSYEHRRQWIEARILELADCFCVSVYAYAVMHNHFHVVLHVTASGAVRQGT